MKSYRDFDKEHIGISDIATLILVGSGEDDLNLVALNFGEDGSYYAYIVDAPAEIGSEYNLVATFDSWLKIYDDVGLVALFRAPKINVYRNRGKGCIIEKIFPEE